MKKTAILLIGLYAFSYFAKAQSQPQSYVEGGIIIMPQYTTLLNTNDLAAGNDLNYVTTFGYAGGLSGAYNFNKHIGVELNLIYSVQGQKYMGNLNDYNSSGADLASYANLVAFQAGISNISPISSTVNPYTDQISLTYFKIPVMFKLTGNTEKSTFFYMTVGPEFNFLLSASESLNGRTVNYSSTNPTLGVFSFQTKQLFESSGVNAVLNLGIGINITSNLVLTGQVNFDYGLTDAENKSFEFAESIAWPSGEYVTQEVHPYASNRSSNNNATASLKLGLAYKFVDVNKVSSKFTP